MKHFGMWRATAAALLMAGSAGCAGGADADEPEPTVLETPPEVTEDSGASASEDSDGEDFQADSSGEPEPTPIPASSDGPAQNWPVPEPPEEIYEPTEEGAEALLQYWFDARHFARITGDTEPLEDVSHEDCELCRAEIELIEDVFTNGGWYVSEPDLIDDSFTRQEVPEVASGMFALKESDFESFWDGNSHGETLILEVGAYQFTFIYVEYHWQVTQFHPIGTYHGTPVEGRSPR